METSKTDGSIWTLPVLSHLAVFEELERELGRFYSGFMSPQKVEKS